MSSEKDLDRDTRELSEFEVLLIYARSATVISEPQSPTPDTLAGHYPGVLSTITKRLKELADQESAYKLKSIQTISRRQIYDAAVEQCRTEDEKHGAILGMPDLKEAALGNVNLSDLESYIVICVRRKWFFSRFLCFFPLLV